MADDTLDTGPADDDNFREGVLLLRQDGVFIQRYFTVYNYRISYSHRGKEKRQEFTPVTMVVMHEDQFAEKLFPFTVETPGQPPYEMAAETREDMLEWIECIKVEVTRLVASINLEYERKGYGDYAASMNGSLLNEGRFSSYVYRRQNEQVVPIFLSLADGKLTARKLATMKSAVGSWRLGPDATVQILNEYAAPALQIDKETVIVANEGIRADWMVALKTAIENAASAPPGKSFHAVDFGNPAKYTAANGRQTVKLPHTLRLRQTGTAPSDEDDQFFRPFTGSVRLVGSIRLVHEHARPTVAADFSTFQVNEDVDDTETQEQFRRLRLDDYDEDEDATQHEGGEEGDEDREVFESPAKLLREADGEEDDHSNDAAASKGLASDPSSDALAASASSTHIAKSLSVPGPLERPRPPSMINPPKPQLAFKGNYGAGPKRIRMTQKTPEGPIRVYGGDLRTGELCKTVLATNETTTTELLQMVLIKYDRREANVSDYSLVEEEVGTPYVRVLDDYESPLIARLNWDNRQMQFVVRLKSQVKDVADMRQFFRVKFIDGSGTSLGYDENLPSVRVCELVAQKAGLQPTSTGYFALWMEGAGLTLQLEPYQLVRVLNEDWPALAKRFAGISDPPPFQIVFRRWAFLSKSVERRVKDPAAISLLCKEAIHAVLHDLYPCPEDEAVELAALQCQIEWGDYDPAVHRPGLLSRQEDLEQRAPQRFLSQSTFKPEAFEAKVLAAYANHQGKAKMIVELLYLQRVRQWPFYGSTFFTGKMVTAKAKKVVGSIRDDGKKGTQVRVGVNAEGIHVFDIAKNSRIFSQGIEAIEIVQDVDTKSVFAFQARLTYTRGTMSEKDREYTLVTIFSLQAPLIHQFVVAAKAQMDEDARVMHALRSSQRYSTNGAVAAIERLKIEGESEQKRPGSMSDVPVEKAKLFKRRSILK